MALYKIFLMPSVKKDIRKIAKIDQQKILKRIESLAVNPRPHGYKKLMEQNRYRVQQGDYRIIYEIHDNELIVWIVTVGNRRDVYRVSEEKEKYIAGEKTDKTTKSKI
jgi:mRNA interferase RelE/StbE